MVLNTFAAKIDLQYRGANHYEKIVISLPQIQHYNVMPVYYSFWKCLSSCTVPNSGTGV